VGTVSEYVVRARQAGLAWPLLGELDDAALEARLFPALPAGAERPMPDLAELHQELKGAGVTLQLLWEEYRGVHGESGYGYSQFCEHYRRWARMLQPSMRQVHHAGEKLFVDFSGKRPHIVDRRTGELIPVELGTSSGDGVELRLGGAESPCRFDARPRSNVGATEGRARGEPLVRAT
jgi:transposase